MNIFHAPDISAGVLPEEESAHAVRVLRLTEGAEIIILDGTGGYYEAKITLAHPKKCLFEVVNSVPDAGKRNFYLHVAIAPTKNIERFEWFLEKATEIGIDEITPLLCRFSERKILKPERLEKIIVAASKQSVKSRFPKLNDLIAFDRFIAGQKVKGKFIAHCYDGEKTHLKDAVVNSEEILILIGPEGDFSREEVEMAQAGGYMPITLGQSRLRTETAGVVACAQVGVLK